MPLPAMAALKILREPVHQWTFTVREATLFGEAALANTAGEMAVLALLRVLGAGQSSTRRTGRWAP